MGQSWRSNQKMMDHPSFNRSMFVNYSTCGSRWNMWAVFKNLCRAQIFFLVTGFPWWIVIFPITLVSINHEIPYNHQPNAGFWTLLKYFAILDLASLICRLFAAINSLVLYWLRSFALKRKNIYMWFGGRCILWDKIASLLAGEEGGCILRPPKNPKT